ncbi:MAG: hypothetical protein FJ009_00325 [Chloroflexi bacterium]|nr:hypothetical protein [Chloroflexota bacterium]
MRRIKQKHKSGIRTTSGQSMLEVAVALPFLLLIIFALLEMGIVFASYLSLVNATREGAVFATMYPDLAHTTCGATPNPSCVGPKDSQTFGAGSTLWREYVKRVNDDIVVVIGEPLRAGQILMTDTLTVSRPIVAPGSSGSSCITGKEPGCFITVTVTFNLKTFTSDMSLPVPRARSGTPAMPGSGATPAQWTNWFFAVMGNVDWATGWRMGLPNYYQIRYTYSMPIR